MLWKWRPRRHGSCRVETLVGAFLTAATFAALLCSGSCSEAQAQPCQPGELRVAVKDSQQSPIFDARVRIASGTHEVGTQQTRAMGLADFADVPCGNWIVTANKQGFEESKSNVEMKAGESVEVTLSLDPELFRSSVEVKAEAPAIEQSASENNQLRPSEVKPLPTNPATVTETLPLVPGIVRSPQGELIIDGTGEQRSAFVVNQSDVTDPATGKFGQTVPVDAVENVNVLNVPFLAQYGRFTQTVVAGRNQTRRREMACRPERSFPGFSHSQLSHAGYPQRDATVRRRRAHPDQSPLFQLGHRLHTRQGAKPDLGLSA